MPRGRQYYDPIEQAPGKVEGEQDLSRVEVYQDESMKWCARQVAPDGSLTGRTLSDFDQPNLLKHVAESWPELQVYELRNEGEDSTWEGHGPSPRLWQNSSDENTERRDELPTSVAPQPTEEQAPLRILPISEPGVYVALRDICGLLEMWAVSYEVDKNPSGALALREAVDALKEIG